ncbi:hypothetical protein [Aeromonas hydrophila]|uniref:hypothetical protein n=1 Tax=Aeromonas hydrophila TaxID=644 RepID=UPI001116BDDA|nr:hypothetical protein [Aeromonas hydrophila]
MLSSEQKRKLRLAAEHVRGVFASASPLLTAGVGFCLLIMLLNAIWWDHLLEPFNGANNLIKIVMDLFAAIVASYLFYLIIEVSPTYSRRRKIYLTVVCSELNSIATMHRNVINQFMDIKDRPHAFESISTMAQAGFRTNMEYKARNIQLGAPSPFISPETLKVMSWLELFARDSKIENEALDRILVHKDILDTDQTLLFNGLKDTHFKSLVRLYSSMASGGNLSLTSIVKEWHQHIVILNYTILNYEESRTRMGLQLERAWQPNNSST